MAQGCPLLKGVALHGPGERPCSAAPVECSFTSGSLLSQGNGDSPAAAAAEHRHDTGLALRTAATIEHPTRD
ncbi:hypothetical protein AOLI_G00126950 [Acnodon oligacanthus]